MSGFGKLAKYKITSKTVSEYKFEEFPGAPYLVCRPATKENEKYISAVLADKSLANVNAEKDVDIAKIAALYADTVITGWGNMGEISDSGADKPKCDRKSKINLITTLIKDHPSAFLMFTLWSGNVKNFYNIDVEEEAKNS